MATSGPASGQSNVPTGPEKPPAYLFSSIFVTILCCAPFGIVAIIYGLLVQTRWRSGDERGSQHASDMAEKWMYGGIGAGVLLLIGGLVYWFFVGRHNGEPELT
jgi:hypothetical protein